ncbi:terminase gpA endonuclease subunit [Endozoicomonas lisbonensis]
MQPANRNSHGINSTEAIDASVKSGLAGLFKPEPMKLSEWAEEHYYLSPESSSEVGTWETIPYQKAIMNCISNDDVRKITWMKSARTGYTKVIVAAMGYFAEHKKRNQVIYQPTDDDRDAFVKDEIEPMLRDVPSVQSIFPFFDKKHKNNTLQKKTFLGSQLHMLGGKSPRNFRRITVDVAYYDELAGFDHDIGGEGSATSLGDTRLTTSSFPKSIRGSTPKTSGTCQIEQSLNEADVVLFYHVPCPHCNEMQYLKWGGKGAEFGIRWEEGKPKTAHYICEHCKDSFGYEHLADMLEQGRWQNEEGTVWIDDDDLFRDDESRVIDAPSHVGFRLWAAYSIFMTWEDLAAESLSASKDAKRGELGKLKSFVNTRLG